MSVVLDLGEIASDDVCHEWLRNAARDLERVDDYRSSRVNLLHWLADKIEAQLPKPKPAEPTGLGAVVVDSNDVTWVLAGRDLPTSSPDNWRAFDGPIVGDWKPYDRIDAVRVLSEGVAS